MTPTAFIALLMPAAKASMVETKVPASFVIAQAALESAWGKSALATDGFNLFGVKADKAWNGQTICLPTREYLNGKWCTIPATWRRYPNWKACIDDHAQFFIKNSRYKPAFEYVDDGEEFARAVANCGYATDPRYGEKLISVIRAHNLLEYDKA